MMEAATAASAAAASATPSGSAAADASGAAASGAGEADGAAASASAAKADDEFIYVGTRVRLDDGRLGTVRFKGPVFMLNKGTWYGVELEEASGKNDGDHKGEFCCVPIRLRRQRRNGCAASDCF
jgi:type IV secretory pathway TrbL component